MSGTGTPRSLPYLSGIFIVLSFILLIPAFTLGQSVVVSSYFNAASEKDEWSELLVVQDNLDLRGWSYRDNNSTQTSWQPEIYFNNIPFWNNMRAGTIIIIWHRAIRSDNVTPNVLDVNKADGYIQVAANDVNYFNGGSFASNTLNVAGAGDILELRDAANVHIHCLGHKVGVGASYGPIPLPKLNHAQSIASLEAVMVFPGTNIAEYGTNAPQDGTTWTTKNNVTTFGLPNNNPAAPSPANSNYWRSLRHPGWNSPSADASLNAQNTQVSLTWNQATDPNAADATQGYIILRNNADNFTAPVDGTTYTAGQTIGSAAVIAVLGGSATLSYVDNITIPCGEERYYRIYAYRYATDNINGSSFDLARGRAYNETNFGAADVDGPPIQSITATISPASNDICLGSNATFSSTNDGVGLLLYQWQENNGSGWTDLTETVPYSGTTTNTLLITAPPITFNGYQYRCRISPQCGTPALSPAGTLNIGAPPVAPASASVTPDIVCVDDPGNITLSATGGSGTELQWFTGSCGGTPIGTGNNLVIASPTVTTTYYVRWGTVNCGLSSCVQTTVTVTPLPTAANAGSDGESCGLTYTLTGNNPSSGTGTWTQVSGPGTSIFGNASLYNSSVSVSTYGTYVFRWTISTGGACAPSFDDVTVVFSNNPSTSNAGPDQALCATLTATLEGNSPAVGTGLWTKISGPGTAVFTDATVFNTTVSVSAYGAYVFRWTITSGTICPASTDDVGIGFNEPPTVSNAGPDQSLCATLSTTMAANTALVGAGLWTQISGPGTIVFANASSPTTAVTAPVYGNYVLQWTITNGLACPASSDDVAVSFSTAITVNASNNGPICEGLDLELYSDISGATYLWSGPAGFSSTLQNPVIASAGIANSGMYTVTVSNIPGGCPASTNNTTATVNNIPVTGAINPGNSEACVGSVVTYTVTGQAGSTYTWIVTGGTVLPPGNNASVDIAWGMVPGPYSIEVTQISSQGCQANTVSTSVDLRDLPTAFAGNDDGICEGDNYTLNQSTASNYQDILWTSSGTGIFNDANALHPTYTPSATDVAAGSVVLTMTASYPASGCGPVSASMTLTISAGLTLSATIVAPVGPVCDGQQISLSLNITDGGSNPTYAWYLNGTFSANTDIFTFFVSAGDAVYCTITSSLSCAANSPFTTPTININVSPEVVFNNVFKTDAECGFDNGGITVQASGGTPPLSYSINGGIDFQSNADFSNLPAGTYLVAVKDQAGCVTNYTTNVVINSAGGAQIDNVSATDTHCNQDNGTITIVASGGTNPLQYSIDNGISWSPTSTFSLLSAGNYFISVKDANNCLSAYPTTVVINQQPGPQLVSLVVTDETDGLANGSVVINVSGNGPFEYSLDGVNWQSSNTFSNLQAGDYGAFIRDANNCVLPESFTVQNISSGNIVVGAGIAEACLNNTLTIAIMASGITDVKSFGLELAYDASILVFTSHNQLNASLAGGTFTIGQPSAGLLRIQWQGSQAVDIPDGALLFNLLFYGIQAGNAALSWQQSSFTSGAGNPLNATLSDGSAIVHPLPLISTGGNGSYCEGGTVSLTATSHDQQQLSWLWIGPDGQSNQQQNWTRSDLALAAGGEYQLLAINGHGCQSTSQLSIEVMANPVVSLSESDTLCSGSPVELDAGEGFTTYTWSNGETTQKITVSETGTYSVTVATAIGCEGNATVWLQPCDFRLLMPNAFSPNHDGLNDTFGPVFGEILPVKFRMMIYNSWGQMIYETSDYNAPWDGKCKGEMAEAGVYAYIVHFDLPPYLSIKADSPIRGTLRLIR